MSHRVPLHILTGEDGAGQGGEVINNIHGIKMVTRRLINAVVSDQERGFVVFSCDRGGVSLNMISIVVNSVNLEKPQIVQTKFKVYNLVVRQMLL